MLGAQGCGAATYRVLIHGPESDFGQDRGRARSSISHAAASNGLFGVHSAEGWKRTLPVHFMTSHEIPSEQVEDLKNAMEIWECAVGKTLFVHDGVENKSGQDFADLYDPLNYDVNGHYFDFKWSDKTGKSSLVLATTIWENHPKFVQSILKSNIRFNAETYLFGNALKQSSQGQKIIVDMQSLSLHEVGHFLGLTHIATSEDAYSVMNPALYIGEGMTTRRLSYGDIQRIRSIYGVGDTTWADTLEKADDF